MGVEGLGWRTFGRRTRCGLWDLRFGIRGLRIEVWGFRVEGLT